VAQHDQRPLALLDKMEINPICVDRAMRSAAGGLRERPVRLADSANRCRAKVTNEFTSPHRRFSHLTAVWP
jgi:hypothetical protein